MINQAQNLGAGAIVSSDASLQAAHQRQMAQDYVHQIDPAELERREAAEKAEQERWKAEQAQERDERNRATALQLACAVCGSQGDSGSVLDAASGFLAFLSGADKRPH